MRVCEWVQVWGERSALWSTKPAVASGQVVCAGLATAEELRQLLEQLTGCVGVQCSCHGFCFITAQRLFPIELGFNY